MRTILRTALLALVAAVPANRLSAQTPAAPAAPAAPVVAADSSRTPPPAIVADSSRTPPPMVVADSSRTPPPVAPAAPARPAQRSTSNRLVAADINDAPYTNVYDLIRARRPRWLRVRLVGARGQTEVVRAVVDNGAPMSAEALKDIAPADVDRMEFRDAFDASGSGSTNQTYAGTIYVWMKR